MTGKKHDDITRLHAEWTALQPLSPDDKRRLDRQFMLSFNYNSNHIEGNTLTYGQTEILLLFGKVAGDADMKDLEDMKAHNIGLRMTQDEASRKGVPLTETFILQLHKTLLRDDYTVAMQLPGGIQSTYTVHAGIYKTRPNSVITATGERFDYATPEETPALMTDLVAWYNSEEAKKELSTVELAAIFHYRFTRIHPFEDGNGRMARLLFNYILARHDYPMAVVKTADKNRYLMALHKADVLSGNVPSDGAHADKAQTTPFIDYMEDVVATTLAENISFIKKK